MFSDVKTALFGDRMLAQFNFFIEEFFDQATVEADQMVVVRALVQFKNGLAGLEMIPVQQAGLLELRQDAIYRGQADIHVFKQQDSVDIFGAQVAHAAVLENIENFQSWQGRLEAAGFKVARIVGHDNDRKMGICFII